MGTVGVELWSPLITWNPMQPAVNQSLLLTAARQINKETVGQTAGTNFKLHVQQYSPGTFVNDVRMRSKNQFSAGVFSFRTYMNLLYGQRYTLQRLCELMQDSYAL